MKPIAIKTIISFLFNGAVFSGIMIIFYWNLGEDVSFLSLLLINFYDVTILHK
jgi:hypothetical protein